MSVPAYQSITDFYRDPASPYAGFTQEHRSGGSMPVKLLRAEQEAFEGTDPAVPEVVLGLNIRADYDFRWDVGDGWTDACRLRDGNLCLFPAYTAVPHECRDKHYAMMCALPVGPLAEILDVHCVGSLATFDALTGATAFRDEPIRRTLQQLWTESARTGGTSDLLIDGLTQILIARLLDKAGTLARPVLIPTLSQTEVARLDELIDNHLAERITVETLARALDMPRWTFSDAFKATTSETPHAYVTARRVERACDLLRFGDLPLAEIAYATGFAGQSHMTDTFRRHLDTTPGAWRREVRT